jgi:hypothetical protein
MEPDTIKLHCSNCEPSRWIQLPKEKVIIMLDLKSDQWIFEAECHLCGNDILNARKAF